MDHFTPSILTPKSYIKPIQDMEICQAVAGTGGKPRKTSIKKIKMKTFAHFISALYLAVLPSLKT
ncbi:hypothetical protein VRU48_02165 [Pedobacter sp. KR3-3]|uniref:Uncharacterized protein n=1 Tax=Pedobacter albus TaxID=3113905 RepID=A0ABU7I3C1_9SPHI|nr:hypothetical protein [Pedobacter sp. KR3-3]MEE1943894.1 hypothetical protein [Pedobacter sp. KR3-3]